MTSMEQETLRVITENHNSLHYYLLARKIRISSHYAYVICKGLERGGYVAFDTLRGACSLTKKAKNAIKRWA